MKWPFTLAGAVLATCYWIGALIYLVVINSVGSTDVVGAWQNLIDFLLTLLLLPHMLLLLLGIVFAWVGLGRSSLKMILASAVLLCVGAVLGFLLFKGLLLTVPAVVFSFIGYFKMQRQQRDQAFYPPGPY